MSDSSIITEVDGKSAIKVFDVTGLVELGNLASYLVEVDGKTCVAVAFVGDVPVDSIPNLPASKITSGEFADARISESSVLQHDKIRYKEVPGDYVITEADKGYTLNFNSATDVDCTVNPGLSDGFYCNARRKNTGVVIFLYGLGVTADPANLGHKLETRGTTAILEHQGSNEIYLEGRLTS